MTGVENSMNTKNKACPVLHNLDDQSPLSLLGCCPEHNWWFTPPSNSLITLWLFSIAMENGPFIDGLPIKNGDFL